MLSDVHLSVGRETPRTPGCTCTCHQVAGILCPLVGSGKGMSDIDSQLQTNKLPPMLLSVRQPCQLSRLGQQEPAGTCIATHSRGS